MIAKVELPCLADFRQSLDRKRRIVVVCNGLPEMIRRDVAHAGSLPEESSSSSHLPAWIGIFKALGDSPALRETWDDHDPLAAGSRSADSSSNTSYPLRGRKG